MKYIQLVVNIIVVVALIIISLNLFTKSNIIPSRLLNIQHDIDSLEKGIIKLRYDVLMLQLSSEENSNVDLTNTNLQDIGNGFHVGNIAVSQHLTGIKIKGIILNATSVTHKNVKFEIKIAGQSNEFFINIINSGHCSSFDVYVPNVPIEKTQYCLIKYVESVISYYY